MLKKNVAILILALMLAVAPSAIASPSNSWTGWTEALLSTLEETIGAALAVIKAPFETPPPAAPSQEEAPESAEDEDIPNVLPDIEPIG